MVKRWTKSQRRHTLKYGGSIMQKQHSYIQRGKLVQETSSCSMVWHLVAS